MSASVAQRRHPCRALLCTRLEWNKRTDLEHIELALSLSLVQGYKTNAGLERGVANDRELIASVCNVV